MRCAEDDDIPSVRNSNMRNVRMIIPKGDGRLVVGPQEQEQTRLGQLTGGSIPIIYSQARTQDEKVGSYQRTHSCQHVVYVSLLT
jgi:hypothetical protein